MGKYEEILISKIFDIKNDNSFNEVSLEIFDYQYKNVSVYRNYCDHIKSRKRAINHYSQIPFLPIQFFKSQKILHQSATIEILFKSSGTTSMNRGTHYIASTDLYVSSFLKGFTLFYGVPEDWVVLALLPSYQENGASSLLFMVDHLVALSTDNRSGFYLNHLGDLPSLIKQLAAENKKTLLCGVSYALLDMVEHERFEFKDLVVMETGGMKGRRKEMTKEKLHEKLRKGFGVDTIHSEYGMTELLSQGYSKNNGFFSFPPWIKPLTRAVNDPFSIEEKQKTGGINIIDLANLYSCCFIATQDLGRITGQGLQLMGRFDHSDTRGCNLLLNL